MVGAGFKPAPLRVVVPAEAHLVAAGLARPHGECGESAH